MSRTVIDQMGRPVSVPDRPKRIISLVPSQTELLSDLGLKEEVVGITRFCVHPERWFNSKARVGGTKKLNLEKIRSLAPDLLIGNVEENSREDMEAIFPEYPVWMSDIKTLGDALDMMKIMGTLVDREKSALQICRQVSEEFARLEQKLTPGIRALYLIWYRPWMGAGGDTFIHDMLSRCGFTNVLADQLRYPQLSEVDVASLNPDVVLLSSEPFPFREKHVDAIRDLLPGARIQLVDGELFSWYGSRLLQSPAYFRSLLKHIRSY